MSSRQLAYKGAVISEQDLTRNLPTSVLANRCREETTRFFQKEPHDTRFCYELFRRASVEDDQIAWERIYQQYKPLIMSWIHRHSGFALCDEEADYFLNRAYEKLWNALTPKRFPEFPGLESILSYLQMCVHSCIVDHLRLGSRHEMDLRPLDASNNPKEIHEPRQLLERAEREDLWTFVHARMNDDKERCCLHSTFTLGMKPGQIYEKFPELFESVHEVYQVKQNLLSRLRRDPMLGNLT